ncbi:MAG TPA: hypothetical protein VLL82_16215 [Mycobacterium sp.]|nr:hypothetical protein [Mycobacterium sp.]
MPDEYEEFSDDEAAFFFECEERQAEIRKAKRCSDPQLRDTALAYLREEILQSGAKLLAELLDADDDGEVNLSGEARAACLECIELAIDRPDWYQPGERVVLPPEQESDDGDN